MVINSGRPEAYMWEFSSKNNQLKVIFKKEFWLKKE